MLPAGQRPRQLTRLTRKVRQGQYPVVVAARSAERRAPSTARLVQQRMLASSHMQIGRVDRGGGLFSMTELSAAVPALSSP
ncbi:hypothetical protein [Cryobacterium sp. Hb1]|uniref:hypothetical protein n=1 Tax=Cryobacterium sp. Hb1 TaxID=1259147 RepID=UPI00106CE681|nr:hypothetical protein [Cryobacterium sp. Hb1]TFD64616.1 hypothetical protein E3T38_15990 [Cryobacterium sp. Hb1]